MKILAIDTSTMSSELALLDEGEIIGELSINQEKTHSESLVPMISYLLDSLGLSLGDIDRFAVGLGPGSFTGLRIGMTTGKTLAQVLNKELVGVSTLEALAKNVNQDGYILSLLDARGGRTYYGLYKKEGTNFENILEDELAYGEDLPEILKDYSGISAIGEYTQETKDILAKIVKFECENLNGLIARNIAYLARDKEPVDLYKLNPNYVRKSQAQRDLDERK